MHGANEHWSRTEPVGGARLSDAPAGRVFLTFDDGPDPVWTPRVLEALREADARATFFVVAPEALRHPALVSEMLLAGHRVEFHCSAHLRHTERTRLDVEADTREGLRDLASLGVSPRLWRPPWGVSGPWTEALADAFGLRLALWTIDPHDWRGDTAPAMLDHAERRIAPGSVVLLHDGLGPGALRPGCGETVSLIGPLVKAARAAGCEPAPMTPADTDATSAPGSGKVPA